MSNEKEKRLSKSVRKLLVRSLEEFERSIKEMKRERSMRRRLGRFISLLHLTFTLRNTRDDDEHVREDTERSSDAILPRYNVHKVFGTVKERGAAFGRGFFDINRINSRRNFTPQNE